MFFCRQCRDSETNTYSSRQPQPASGAVARSTPRQPLFVHPIWGDGDDPQACGKPGFPARYCCWTSSLTEMIAETLAARDASARQSASNRSCMPCTGCPLRGRRGRCAVARTPTPGSAPWAASTSGPASALSQADAPVSSPSREPPRAARVEHLSQIPAGPAARPRTDPAVRPVPLCATRIREAAGQNRRDLLQSARIQHAGDDQAPRPGQVAIATWARTDGGRRPGRSRAGGRKWAVEGSARPGRAGSGTDQRCGPGVHLRRRTQLVVPRDQSAEQARNGAAGAADESRSPGRGPRGGLREGKP